MKKLIFIVLILLLFLLLTGASVFARHDDLRPPSSFINLYRIDHKIAAGLKQHVLTHIYATGNLEYRSEASDLELQFGTVYLLPQKILFFRLYGGTGLQFSRNEGYQYPYLVLGTHFLFFFSEVIHPWHGKMEPKFRGGFSFHF
jgi:hypothetical protein